MKVNWTNHLIKKVEDQTAVLAKSQQENKTAAAKAGGQSPLPTQPQNSSDPASGDPIAFFNNLVAEKQKTGMPRHKAFVAVCHENVQAREAYVATAN